MSIDQTAKFKSANILEIAILGSTAKFNSHQYFWLYGNYYCIHIMEFLPGENFCQFPHLLSLAKCLYQIGEKSFHEFPAKIFMYILIIMVLALIPNEQVT